MGGRSWALLSNRAGVARAGNYSVVTRKSVIVETARSQMVDTNWMDFSRISWVEDDDGTVMGECGSGDVVVGSKSGTATAAVGATAMDGAGGRGAGDGIRGTNRRGTVGRQGTIGQSKRVTNWGRNMWDIRKSLSRGWVGGQQRFAH